MTAATKQMPTVPPRPTRGMDKDNAGSTPKVPPRPAGRRIERSVSPNPDRFAPSPLNEGILAKHSKVAHLSPTPGLHDTNDDPIERSGSVPLPGVGEEGAEYAAVSEDAQRRSVERSRSRTSSPEQTRTVANDLKLHAPKPSLPADSAKQRVQAVTRTDSDRAASFGIGRPSMEDRAYSHDGIKKKPSTSFSTSSDHGGQVTDDEHGIPEIGQRVPMNPHLGDVQAPSPAPSETSRHHVRKHSARGLPPGSYGLHGHGQTPQDKLEKAYYQKHPELLKQEHYTLHQRQHDFAMSSADLNKLVKDTANRDADVTAAFRGTPTDEVAFQASDEYAHRISSRPTSMIGKDSPQPSPLVKSPNTTEDTGTKGDDAAIHVDEPTHPEYRSYGNETPAAHEEDHEYSAPILASDQAGSSGNYLNPAVHPPPERRGSAFEMEDAPSRPSSRPVSLHHNNSSQPEIRYTPLEDVEEYEPLFTEDSKKQRTSVDLSNEKSENKDRRHFPSKDIWEDAPSSVHYTATVSTPDLPEHHRTRSSGTKHDRPHTPAHAFAQQQEELAEKESRGQSAGFLPLSPEKPNWAAHQAHLKSERPSSGHRFPSRDVWEDTPESHLYETTVSSSPKEESKPEVPSRPAKRSSEPSERPAIPSRPKPRQGSGDDAAKARPTVSEKPKPNIPARPSKSPSNDTKEAAAAESSRSKPPVPSRPVGGKIAALQAGFMSDLNKRLQLGPQGPKKEEPAEEAEAPVEEKAPLSDARKGRARGPQRRAPAKSPAPVTEAPKLSAPTLTFALPQSSWSIDPDNGSVAVKKDEEITEQPSPDSTPAPTAPVDAHSQPESDAAGPSPEKPAEEVKPAPEEPETVVEPVSEPVEEQEASSTAEEPGKVEKTLVANTAGESVLEATIEKTEGGDDVEPVEVKDEVKS